MDQSLATRRRAAAVGIAFAREAADETEASGAMLRITQNRHGGSVVLRLEGRIGGPWIEVLKTVCAPLLHRGVVLDLSGVSFVEQRGALLLRQLARRRVRITGGTPFVHAQLAGKPPPPMD